MVLQLIAIFLVAAIALGSLLIYNKLNRTYYIEYTENGKIDYMVKYRQNEFFDTEWIGMDQTYISSLIEGMTADFIYQLNTVSTDLDFKYQYSIDAKVLIANRDAGTPYYTYEENILPQKESSAKSGASVEIKETVWLDFVKYHQMAQSFIQTYNLKEVSSCTLIVTLHVDILTSNQQFNKESQNTYTVDLNVPLAVESLNVHKTSSAPDNEVKVLEYQDIAERKIFFTTAISAGMLDLILILLLIVFLHLTKNEDVTYEAKIRKILRSYRSFIQRMEGEFEYEGYQQVMIKSFTELLGIRDTIQAPVLMSENHDETMTKFLVPTASTRILYVYEIKVDNYDEIYKNIKPVEIEIEAEPEAPIVNTVEAEPEPVPAAPAPAPAVVEKLVVVEKPVEAPVAVAAPKPVSECPKNNPNLQKKVTYKPQPVCPYLKKGYTAKKVVSCKQGKKTSKNEKSSLTKALTDLLVAGTKKITKK